MDRNPLRLREYTTTILCPHTPHPRFRGDKQQPGEELKAHVREKLAPYKHPRWIAFADMLPMNANGKIVRFRLREMEQQAGD